MAEQSTADPVPAPAPADAATEQLPAVTERLPATTGERLPATSARPSAAVDLPGIRKAAVLMAALGSERAANVLQRLGEAEIETLSMEMASLSSVEPDTTEAIFNELAQLTGTGEMGVAGGVDFARGVIERALGPDRANELLGRFQARTESPPFEFLRRVPQSARQRCCATRPTRRSRWSWPASTRPWRPACSRACPTASSRTSRCASRAWARRARA